MASKKAKSSKQAGAAAARKHAPPARRHAEARSAGGPAVSSTRHSLLKARDLVLGVDGGGSHTVAMVASAASHDGERPIEVLGRGTGGPSNHVAVGRDRAIRSLDDAIGGAFRAAGVSRGTVATACLGLAGADRVSDRKMFTAWADSKKLAARVLVENDASLVLAAGTPEGWGLAVIAGTGSFAVARMADGRTRRSGGWGYLLGDEGSGYAIAVEALRAVARAADNRGPATSLTQALLTRLRIAEPQSLIAAVGAEGMGRPEIAALAEIVSRESAAGDATAHHILVQASVELTNLALAATRLFRDESLGFIPVAFCGGVFGASEQLRDEVILNLLAQGLNPDPVRFVSEPALGAIRLARATAAG